MNSAIAALRSTFYTLLQIIITPFYTLIILASFPLTPLNRSRITSGWAHIMLYLIRVICGVRYRVLGIENIPKIPSIVLSKHQSAWETLAFQQIFPPQVWVLKKELLRIPFFGWGLAMTSPIAINRSSVRAALKQIVQQGKDRLNQGFWIVIFPEGTRIVPGKKGKYAIGGAWLATHTGVPVGGNEHAGHDDRIRSQGGLRCCGRLYQISECPHRALQPQERQGRGPFRRGAASTRTRKLPKVPLLS